MKQDRYIQWQNNTSNSLDQKIAEIMKHWEARYELGAAVLLSDSPASALKNVQKQWRKLTIQAQKVRESKKSAEDILNITRTISRMQRVKFTTEQPDQEPDAAFYILKPDEIISLPTRCLTLYSLAEVPDSKLLAGLAPDALAVVYLSKQSIPNFKSKSLLEERVQTEEARLLGWLHEHSIEINEVTDNVDKANEALDSLLSSNALQSEFLHKVELFFHTVKLAQPLKLSTEQTAHLEALDRLEKHVRVLSPTYLSDHIVDSQNDDSFLLRDIASGKFLTLNSLKYFIAQQYQLGHQHLASALEQKAGFVRI